MRLPLAIDLKSRDGATARDAGSKNAIIETSGESSALLKRPGTLSLGAAGTGVSQLLACYNGQLRSIIGNTLADLIITTSMPPGTGAVHVLPTTPSQLWVGVGYGNGMFLAKTQDDETCATSTDGVTWAQGSDVGAVVDGTWESVAYGAGLFVVMPLNNFNAEYVTTPDGVTWTTRAFPASLETVSRIRFVNGLFVVGTYAIDMQLFTSPDGINWTERFVDLGEMTSDAFFMDVAYGNGKYAFHTIDSPDHYISTTTDFVSWTHTLTVWAAFNSILFDSGNFIIPGKSYSADGISWTNISGATTTLDEESSDSAYGRCVSVFADNLDNQYSYLSEDGGVTWSLISSLGVYGTPHGWVAVSSGDDGNNNVVFVAVSDTSDYALFAYGSAGGDVVEVEASQAITSIEPSLAFFAEVAGQAQSQNVIVLKNSKEAWVYS